MTYLVLHRKREIHVAKVVLAVRHVDASLEERAEANQDSIMRRNVTRRSPSLVQVPSDAISR